MNKIIISISLICSVLFAKAQKMEDVFVKMPEDMIVQLEEAWRKDLVGLYKAGKTATLENTMQGKSTLHKLTNDYLFLNTSELNTVELKLLPLVNETYIICMIETVYAPVADSRVSFYTTAWKPLPAGELCAPVTEDSFLKGDPSELRAFPGSDLFLVKYVLNAENTTMTAEYTTPQYLDSESRDKIKPLLKTESIEYKWNSARFE